MEERENDRRRSSVAIQESASTDERLARLERTVSNLVDRLDSKQGEDVRPYARGRDTTSTESAPAPVLLIRDIATEVGLSPEHRGSSQSELPSDIITSGLLTAQDAMFLLSLFQQHYGHWVAFDDSLPSARLLGEVRKSPLLLCACCLIAIRHTTHDLATRVAPSLYKEAKSLLSINLLTIPQSIEFFQSSIILSAWSTTIGQVPLSIDSWLVTGFALQHALASSTFEALMKEPPAAPQTRLQADRWRIWNHLCLVHLHYCVGTRRTALLNRTQVDKCRMILASDRATNHEARMVAEVELYWIIYQQCSAERVDLLTAQAALHAWKNDHSALFDQPRSQFLQMGYHFAHLLAYGQALKSGTAAVKESLLSEIVRSSAAILNLAMDTTDDRTRHLTDHIYHIITFASVTLCRLLGTYEDRLRVSNDVESLDALVLSLVQWLRSIGLSCHVAHTLAGIVSALHKKLRPHAPLVSYPPSESDQSFQGDISSFFPELFGSELYNIDNTEYWSGWEQLVQRPTEPA